MPDRRAFLLRSTGGALLALLTACAPAVLPGVPHAPVHLADAEVAVVAGLLRMEDRREIDHAALQTAAGSANPELRRRSALVVGRVRDVRGMPLLVHLSADPDTSVRATSAFALGQFGDTAAVATLAALLDAEARIRAPTVAAEAAHALGKLRSAEAARTLTSLLASVPVAAGRFPAIEEALLAVWRHPREPDPSPILRWTHAPDPELRWRAAYAVVRRPDPAAVSRLVQLADDPDARVRAMAVRGLAAPLADTAGVPRSTVLPVLLAATRDADYATAVNAVRTLGTYDAPASAERLVELLGADPPLAVTAAESLARLGAAADVAGVAAPALSRTALTDEQPIGPRAAALAALVAVAPHEARAVAARLAADSSWRVRGAAGRALAALASRPEPLLAALVRDIDPRVGAMTLQASVLALGDTVAPLRPLLLEALGARDAQLRTAALTGLARLRDPATTPLLLEAYGRALHDPDTDAALAALDALGALQQAGTPVVRTLRQRFPRPDHYLLRQRADNLFGDAIRSTWGAPLPVETGRATADYEELARRRVAAPLRGEPLPTARIETDAGMIDLRLFASDAPLTVESFVRLADQGYFDGQEWPRVVPNFVVQGGDPRGDQTGGPGYALRDELNRHRYGRGTLGMALSGPDTGGSQFFITHSPQPHLDGGYTVFGEVIGGMDVVERVRAGERIRRIHLLP
jgi:cyclophilin family peptidyl-prolyl cis-trans isomerase/HEAT repeat protein